MPRAQRGSDKERGGAVGVEMAMLWAVLLLLLVVVIQAGLVFYAGQLALTAAEDGVSAARSYGADPATAERQARGFLTRAAGTALGNPAVTASRDDAAGVVRVVVTGEVLSLVPGFRMPITREAVGGVERITP